MTLEAVRKLTNDELRIKVAHLCGIENVGYSHLSNLIGTKHGTVIPVPSYPFDLNATDQFEKAASEQYWKVLAENVRFDPESPEAPSNIKRLAHATARERCEVFVAVSENK